MTKSGKRDARQNRGKTGAGTLDGGVDPSVGKATQFQPGQSGNPGGRPKSKPFTEALIQAIADHPELVQEITNNALKRAKNSLSDYREVREIYEGKSGENEGAGDGRTIIHNLNIRFIDPRNKH